MSISGVGSGSGANSDNGDIGRLSGAGGDPRFAGVLAAAALKGERADETSEESKPGFDQRVWPTRVPVSRLLRLRSSRRGLNLTPAQAADLSSLISHLTAEQQAKIVRIP